MRLAIAFDQRVRLVGLRVKYRRLKALNQIQAYADVRCVLSRIPARSSTTARTTPPRRELAGRIK